MERNKRLERVSKSG